MFQHRGSILGAAALALAGLSSGTSINSALQAVQLAPDGRAAIERANKTAPTIRDNLQKGSRVVQPESLKQLFRAGGQAGWRGWKYSGQPTTVAAEKRKALKRRNRLRHKAHCKGKKA